MFYKATLESNLRTRSAVPLPPAIKDALTELFSCLPLRVLIDCWGVKRLLVEGTGTFNKPVLSIAIQHPGVLRSLILTRDPPVLAEAYVTGHLDIGGPIENAIFMAKEFPRAKINRTTAVRAWFAALALPPVDLGQPHGAPWEQY